MSADPDFWPRLVLAILATWRLTHLLAHEDGPFDVIARARATLGQGRWGRMFDCFHCLSLWVAAPLAPWLTDSAAGTAVAWLALSGAACLCERLGQPAVVMHALPNLEEASADPTPQGETHGMLRTTP